MSAFGGNADIGRTFRDVLLMMLCAAPALPDQCCSNVRKFLPRRRCPHMTQADIEASDNQFRQGGRLWTVERMPSAKRRLQNMGLVGGLDRPVILTCLRHREQAEHRLMAKWAIEVAAQSKLGRNVIVEPAGGPPTRIKFSAPPCALVSVPLGARGRQRLVTLQQ
jgi:hypothetical protein